MGLVLRSSGGGGHQKQAVCQWCFVMGCSSSLPLVWTWILAIVYFLGGVVVCVRAVHKCVCVYLFVFMSCF